jgi:hypothetical protein
MTPAKPASQLPWLEAAGAQRQALYHRFRWPLRVAVVFGFVLLAATSGVVGWMLGSTLTVLRPDAVTVNPQSPPPNAGR